MVLPQHFNLGCLVLPQRGDPVGIRLPQHFNLGVLFSLHLVQLLLELVNLTGMVPPQRGNLAGIVLPYCGNLLGVLLPYLVHLPLQEK